jgi:hypothetical protein
MIPRKDHSILMHPEISQHPYPNCSRNFMNRARKRFFYRKICGFPKYLKSKKMLKL